MKTGMTQAQLAEAVDVSVNSVSQWASGMCMPNALTMDDVCKVLDCKLEDIYPRLLYVQGENDV